MSVSRRTFLKISAGAAALPAFGGLGLTFAPTAAKAEIAKFAKTKVTTSVCCHCAVGCGLLVHTADGGNGRCVNLEGNPDHPINEGSLCPKGGSIRKTAENAARPKKPMYRAAHSDKWKEVEWSWALKEIAKRVKRTRDTTFTAKNEKGEQVNRTMGIAHVGSAALDNEECWTLQALMRGLGVTYLEHQARI